MIEGKIYKIKNKDFPGMFYYGSTTQTLNKRLNNHRRKKLNNCSSKILINGNEEIILIQTKFYNNKYELWNREKWFIQNFKCINKYLPNPTDAEKLYNKRLSGRKDYQKNIIERKIKNKKNYEKNKEKVNLKICIRRKERVICPKCLNNLSRGWFLNHYKICNQ